MGNESNYHRAQRVRGPRQPYAHRPKRVYEDSYDEAPAFAEEQRQAHAERAAERWEAGMAREGRYRSDRT